MMSLLENLTSVSYFLFPASILFTIWLMLVSLKQYRRYVESFFSSLFEQSSDPRIASKAKVQRSGPVYLQWLGWSPVVTLAGAKACSAFYSRVNIVVRERALGLGHHFDRFLGDCLGALTGSRWAIVKRAFQPAMLKMQSKASIEIVNREIIRWQKNILDPLAQNGETMDIMSLVGNMPQRIIQSMFFGEQFVDGNEAKLDHLAALSNQIVNDVFCNPLTNTWFHRYLPTTANKTLNEFKYTLAEMVESYDSQEQSIQDQGVLSLVTRKKISNDEFQQTLAEILFANLDISKPSAAWLLVHLALHQDKLNCEYSSIVNYEEDVDVWPEALNFVKESARLAPVGPLSTQQISNCEVFGYAAGTRFSVDLVSLNRDPTVWKDPSTFDPHRFEGKNDNCDYGFMRFGMGTRKCPGRHVADILLSTLLVRCARRYEFSLGSQGIKSSDDLPLTPGAFIVPKWDISVSWRPVLSGCRCPGSSPIFVGVSITPKSPFLEQRKADALFKRLEQMGLPATVILPDRLTRFNVMAFEHKSESQAIKLSMQRSEQLYSNLKSAWELMSNETQQRIQLWRMEDLEAQTSYQKQLVVLRREYDLKGLLYDRINAVAIRFMTLRGKNIDSLNPNKLRLVAEYIMGELPVIICGISRPDAHCTQHVYASPRAHLEVFEKPRPDSLLNLAEKLKYSPAFDDLRNRLGTKITDPGCVLIPM